MDLKLKVLDGKQSGRTVPVVGSKFFIGRAEDCQLRPGSDLVSRHHCVVLVEENYVAARDLGSRNGTFVNGERIIGERELKPGDRLQIGSLIFEVQMEMGFGPGKRPPVADVREAAQRAAEVSSPKPSDVSQWLLADAADDTVARSPHDTQRLDATSSDTPAPVSATAPTKAENEPPAAVPVAPAPKGKGGKPTPGKLPPIPQKASKDSRDAASEVLKALRRRG